jgi:hypothetical protein
MIIGRNSEPNLEGIIRDIKKYTSVKITEAIEKNPQESRKELFLGYLKERVDKIVTIKRISSGNNTTSQLNCVQMK